VAPPQGAGIAAPEEPPTHVDDAVRISTMRMPAEWEPHEATWIAWPHNKDDWPDKFAAIPLVYAEIVRQLHQAEEVRILVTGAAGERQARQVLGQLPLDGKRLSFWP